MSYNVLLMLFECKGRVESIIEGCTFSGWE